jgi:hypothetical protein
MASRDSYRSEQKKKGDIFVYDFKNTVHRVVINKQAK